MFFRGRDRRHRHDRGAHNRRIVYLVLRQSLAQFGGWYLIVLGVSAVIVTRKAPRGIWGILADRFDLRLFPIDHRVTAKEPR